MITKESADCTHAWEDDDGNSCACYECVVKLAERLQSELDEDATDSGRHLALLIEERQRSERLQAIVDATTRWAKVASNAFADIRQSCEEGNASGRVMDAMHRDDWKRSSNFAKSIQDAREAAEKARAT